MNDFLSRFQVADAVAREAADTARQLFMARDDGQFELKGPQDYLTEADGEIERLIRRRIARKFPDDAFFGEEGEERSVGTWTRVVDPSVTGIEFPSELISGTDFADPPDPACDRHRLRDAKADSGNRRPRR